MSRASWRKYKNSERKVVTEATFALKTLTKNNTEQTQINNVKNKRGRAVQWGCDRHQKRRGQGENVPAQEVWSSRWDGQIPRKIELPHTDSRKKKKNVTTTLEKTLAFSRKAKNRYTLWPAIIVLGTYLNQIHAFMYHKNV